MKSYVNTNIVFFGLIRHVHTLFAKSKKQVYNQLEKTKYNKNKTEHDFTIY